MTLIKDDWRMVARRLYLDTNTLIDAVLEPKLSNPRSTGRDRERYISQIIFERWPSTNLRVSPYVIGEIVERGRRPPFDRTLEAMRTIVDGQILARCQTAFFKGDMRLAELYDKIGTQTKWLVSLELRGDAADAKGRLWKNLRGWFRVSRAGQVMKSLFVGLPADAEVPNVEETTFSADSQVKIEAPAFELVLFDTAARLVEETGVNWKDAFHYLYAQWETADSIVTTDEKFIDRAKKNSQLPPVQKPSDIEDWARMYPQFHDAIFGV